MKYPQYISICVYYYVIIIITVSRDSNDHYHSIVIELEKVSYNVDESRLCWWVLLPVGKKKFNNECKINFNV